MKYRTISYVHDLLNKEARSAAQQREEAKEQVKTLDQNSPLELREEIKNKAYQAEHAYWDVSEALDDFLRHDWH